MTAAVRVYVVTYHRPHLLERALRSLIAQTHNGWVAEVLNDDPDDERVAALVARLGDPRIRLSTPTRHRGGTGNFNHAFRTVAEPFASILEDDNWWEPEFLAAMLDALARHPEAALACGNERIWRERPDATWLDTGATVWPTDRGEELFAWNALDKCGSARLCNSSLLFRTAGAERWETPAEIPIEVTEHFRERVVPHPFLQVFRPLVNYAETLVSHRSRDPGVWGAYQVLLVGSVFALAKPDHRQPLARSLWRRARETEPPFAATLLATGWLVPEAQELWRQGRAWEKLGFLAARLRHPRGTLAYRAVLAEHRREWGWLLRGPFADYMANAGD
jgi:Glycosyl transferase family 2